MAFAMPKPRSERGGVRLALILVVGAVVALLLGTYGALHPPAVGQSTFKMFFESMLAFKSWFTTLALVLAVTQLVTGLRIRDLIRWPAQIPLWLPDLHHLLGTLAVLASLPVAYHCLWSLGFTLSLSNPRVLVHAVAGCAFYGAFVSKVLAIRIEGVRDAVVPVLGGVTLALLVAVWGSSALLFLAGRIG